VAADSLLQLVPAISAIASEQLVPAVARQDDSDIGAGRGADPLGGQGGAVGEGLVIDVRQALQGALDAELDPLKDVIGTIASGDLGRMAGFIEGAFGEGHAKAVHGRTGVLRHQGDDRARIDAAR
jgi:hypothetical protein